MNTRNGINRRRFLRFVGASTGAGIGAGMWPFGSAMAALGGVKPDLEVRLEAIPDSVSLFDGTPTRVWRYRARVLAGDPASVTTLPGSYLGPTFHLKRGERVRIHFINKLPEASIVHWHGLHLPDDQDGHPRFAVPAGGEYTYEFTVDNRAGTYWYHPHPHGRTAAQVYAGLAGLIIVSDAQEQALGLPAGEFDLPLVIQDRRVSRDNQLVYPGGMGMMSRMSGFIGNIIMVNGRPDHVLSVARGAYRIRLLNGSNSRIYKLAWDNGLPMTVIGTDGGLLAAPEQGDFVTLAPAQRLELWVDFSAMPKGTELKLKSLAFELSSLRGGMMGGMNMMAGGNGNGDAVDICRIKVNADAVSKRTLPRSLTPIETLHPGNADNVTDPRVFTLDMAMMEGQLNGRSFKMNQVADDEKVRLGSEEIWEFRNRNGGGPMAGALPHPMHIHNLQFQVIERNRRYVSSRVWDDLHPGRIDSGWQDVVLVLPGERVRVQMRFEDHKGLYLYHCHNLEHEDGGMMRNYQVV